MKGYVKKQNKQKKQKEPKQVPKERSYEDSINVMYKKHTKWNLFQKISGKKRQINKLTEELKVLMEEYDRIEVKTIQNNSSNMPTINDNTKSIQIPIK